jgi:DNA repair exonuclease SbcCD nuclease subunit
MFKKIAAFTDLHVGGKSNSQLHLNDCEEFVDWFIANAKSTGCETGIFLGDWHHHRNNINLMTLDTSIRLLEKLGQAFEQFYWFPGNHDLFYKDSRDIHSSIFGKHVPGVTVVNKITTLDDVTMVPWLIGDEWKQIPKIKSKYMFGHFELPTFFMNAKIQMPDHGELKLDHFKNQDYIFSGHFHKRQNKGKVWYIGNAFPHDFSDSGDDDRGMMTLKWGDIPQFHKWDNAPKYRNVKLSQLIDEKDTLMKSKMYLKVNLDIDITFEEATFLKETFMAEYDIREMSLIQDKSDATVVPDSIGTTKFESVDQIVSEELLKIQSDSYDKKALLDIYNSLL